MMSDARGFVRVADRPDAGRAGYRLMLDGAVLDEVWLTIPANELALLGMGPNPTSGTVTLTAVLPEGSSKIDLFDVRGRRVFSRTLTESGNQNIQINPGPLASGVYILRLSAGRQDITRRLFVVR
jgi:hypothetical protein